MAKHRVRIKHNDGKTTFKAIISHPMETGQRKDKVSGKKIPAHYIQKVTITVNGKIILNGNLGPAVSKNPLIHVIYEGGKVGDSVKISLVDNKGIKEYIDGKII